MRKPSISSFALSALFLSLVVSGCKKDDTDNVSRIKSYPAIGLEGDPVIVLNVNDTFTDPGASATLGGAPLAPVVDSNVNTSATGVYTISYTGANTEGDAVSVKRAVVVTDPAVNNLDLSGTYKRGAFAASPLTKVGTKGMYALGNFGFTNAPNLFTAYIVQIDPTHVVVPDQIISGLGYTTFTSVSTPITGGQLTQIGYAVHAPSIFGETVRTAPRI